MRSWRCSRPRARSSSDSGDEAGPDSIYTYDPALVCDGGAVLLRSGKPIRQPEAPAMGDWFERNGIPVLARLEAPALADGGDLLWLDSRTLVIGRGLPHQRGRCLRDQERARALRRRGARGRPADRPGSRLLPAHAQRDLDARPRPRGGLAAAHARASLRVAARARRRADRDRPGRSGTRSRPTCSRSARATS